MATTKRFFDLPSEEEIAAERLVAIRREYGERVNKVFSFVDNYKTTSFTPLGYARTLGECHNDELSREEVDSTTGYVESKVEMMSIEKSRIATYYNVFDFDRLMSWKYGRWNDVSFSAFVTCCNGEACLRSLRNKCISHYYSENRDHMQFMFRCGHGVLPPTSFEEQMSAWFNVDYFNLSQWPDATVRRLKDNGYLEFVKGRQVGNLCRRTGCMAAFRKWLCERFDRLTEHDFFECIETYEAQGKTNHHKKGAAKRMKALNKVFDFGHFYDMSEIQDVNELLRDVDTWLYKTRYPKDLERFVDFVNSWMSQAHRRIAITVLGSQGNEVAKMFMRASAGTLTQEKLDKLDQNQPQFLGELISLAQIVLIIYAIYMGHKHKERLIGLMDAVTGAVVKTTDATCAAAGEAANAFRHIDQVAMGVLDSCKATLAFFKDMMSTVMKKLKDVASLVGRLALEGLLTVSLVFVAFEFARTVFPKLYFEIRSWICAHFGYKDVPSSYDNTYQAQAGGESVLDDIFSFVNSNFVKRPKKYFLEALGDLPKIVSIAKAIEWICDNMGRIWSSVMEAWTGQPIPKIKAESEMYAFAMAVTQLSAEMATFSVDEVFSDELTIRFTMLELEEKKLLQAAARVDKIRPVFTSRFVAACSELRKVRAAYDVRLRTAKKRSVPVWLYIHGEPGVGKSSVLPTLYAGIWEYVQTYGNMTKGPFHEGHVHYLNQSEDFFDGYGKQFFCTIDDLFQSKDPEDRLLNAQRLIHMISPEPYSLRVATVEE